MRSTSRTWKTHEHRKIACLEEIAYLKRWISKDDVMKSYETLKKNQYGQYLLDVLDRAFYNQVSQMLLAN